MDPITSILLVAFVAGLLHYGITKQRARRDAYITHLVSSEQSRRALMDRHIRELEIECGIVEAPQDTPEARLRDAEQFWASVDTGEAVVPLSARSREWKNAHQALAAQRNQQPEVSRT